MHPYLCFNILCATSSCETELNYISFKLEIFLSQHLRRSYLFYDILPQINYFCINLEGNFCMLYLHVLAPT